jgi:RNA polymerase sigma-70 factor (ECF subfamily)
MNVMMDDPEQILLRDRCDDGQLARALLDQYYAPLHYLAYSLLTDTAAADDIVQETLLIALDKIDQYEPGTDLKAWLCRIAIYRCRDVLRRRKIRRKWHEVWLRLTSASSPPRGPEEYASHRQLSEELWQAVGNLDDKHRLPIILHFVHGMTAPEIATLLGIREGTVYSRLHYACRKLAGRFSNSELESWAKELLNE